MIKYLLDTNILVRLLLKDNNDQYNEVLNIFTEIENNNSLGYLSALVLAEVIWVMESFYCLKKKDYIDNLTNLVSMRNIHCLELPKSGLLELLDLYKKKNMSIIDLYLLVQSKGNRDLHLFTFDKELIKLRDLNV